MKEKKKEKRMEKKEVRRKKGEPPRRKMHKSLEGSLAKDESKRKEKKHKSRSK